MKLACISDTHLGFRQFTARTRGRNARTVDVEKAWTRAIKQIVKAKPDYVCMAGDIFHRPHVSNHSIKAYLDGIAMLLTHTDADIITVQGNHDAGRTAATLTPLAVASELDSTEIQQRLWISTQGEHIGPTNNNAYIVTLPFDDNPVKNLELPRQEVGRPNILVMHGRIDHPDLPHFYAKGGVPLDVLAPHFDVVVAGDYHEHVVLPNDHDCLAFYCGATDRVDNNVWQDDNPHGWVLCDVEAGTIKHFPLDLWLRPVYDWWPDTEGGIEGVNEWLAQTAEEYYPGDHEPAMCRIVIQGLPRADKGKLDRHALRKLAKFMLHLKVDFRAAEAEKLTLADRRGEAKTLEQQAREYFAEDAEDVRNRALRYIDEDWAEWPRMEQ